MRKSGQTWYKHKTVENTWVCARCQYRLYYTPRKSRYKSKFLYNNERPLTGYCTWCQNNVWNGSCKLTQMAHFEYDDIHPLDNRVELCIPCHRAFDAIRKILIRNRICLKCHSKTTTINYVKHNPRFWPRQMWYRYLDGFQCQKCYSKSRNNVPIQ